MGMKVFASAINYGVVTPSDSTIVTAKALFVGVGGDVALSASDTATAVVFKNVPSGTFLPIELKNGRVMFTSTTATDIVSVGW